MAGMSMVQELEGLRLASKTYKSELEAMARVNVELKEKLTSVEQAMAIMAETHKTEMVKASEALAKIEQQEKDAVAKEVATAAKVVELEGKMQLVPVVDATAGQAPIADGGAAPEPKVEVDFYAEWQKIDDHVEKAEYYNAHKKEIDGQFSK
jgi:truncated hemoglobin YjbI